MLLNPLSLRDISLPGRMRLHWRFAGDSVLRLLRNLRSDVAAADAAFAAPQLKRRRILRSSPPFVLYAMRYSFDIERNAAKAWCSLTVRGADVARSVKESV